MFTRDQVITEARKLVGTPWRHHGRTPGLNGGLDCVGTLTSVADAISYPYKDEARGYARTPDGELLVRMMSEHLDYVPVKDRLPGDFGVMWFDRGSKQPQHVVIFTPGDMIVHAYEHTRFVVEVPFDRLWQRRLTHVFRLRGIGE